MADGRQLTWLTNGVILAAGCAGSLERPPDPRWCSSAAAWTTPTITFEPRGRRRRTRVLETHAGVLYDTYWPNPGIDAAVRLLSVHGAHSRIPSLPVVVSLGPRSADEALALVGELSGLQQIAAVELNLSGLESGERPDVLAAVVSAACLPGEFPVFVKLQPDGATVDCAGAAEAAGAAAIVVAHGWPGLLPLHASAGGGRSVSGSALAGPAILPLTLRLVDELTGVLAIPVVACGGIATGLDALACLAAGAQAVAVGSALFRDPTAATQIAVALTGNRSADSLKGT